MLKTLVFTAVLLLSAICSNAQTAMRPGIVLGSSVAWPADVSGLNSGHFTVSRAGFQGGLVNTATFADRLILTFGINANIQSFAVRQTGVDKFRFDSRFRAINLEIPLQLGFTGYLGSLRHRELLGVSLQTNVSSQPKIVEEGDSSAAIQAMATTSFTSKVYPVLTAAFEIGSEFENDGALFFGVCFRYGLQEVSNSEVSSLAFPTQRVTYNGTYLGFGLTYYLPRYSYWFKREFIY